MTFTSGCKTCNLALAMPMSIIERPNDKPLRHLVQQLSAPKILPKSCRSSGWRKQWQSTTKGELNFGWIYKQCIYGYFKRAAEEVERGMPPTRWGRPIAAELGIRKLRYLSDRFSLVMWSEQVLLLGAGNRLGWFTDGDKQDYKIYLSLFIRIHIFQ